ncbi:MAG: ribbon-helix-helix domain-containing protein [Terrisporobacter sp.]
MTLDRKEVTRSRFSTNVDKKLLENLDGLSRESKIPKSKLADTALEMLFEKYKIKKIVVLLLIN